MKILLLGEYSNVHWTLAEGLRQLGHEVCVVSDGNLWKNYPRDIDLTRPTNSKRDAVVYIFKLLKLLPQLKGYDIVQIVSPCFLSLRPERSLPVYNFLRKHNKKIFLGAFGTDYYYAKACLETDIYRYSDFKTGTHLRETPENKETIEECMHGGTKYATEEIARTCNGIIACLWEYYVAYQHYLPEKCCFIPLPIDVDRIPYRKRAVTDKLNFFIGIQSARSYIKGTDIIYPILEKVKQEHPNDCHIIKAVDVPYAAYQQLLQQADVQIDQLYSYTPSMNSLLAMAEGVVVVGGGEQENYELIHEEELHPIINIYPSEEDIYKKLTYLVQHKEEIATLSAQSIAYVHKHHHYVKVAQQYLDFWISH